MNYVGFCILPSGHFALYLPVRSLEQPLSRTGKAHAKIVADFR